MTDRDRWIEFFASYGISPELIRWDGQERPLTELVFREGSGGVIGYTGFEAVVEFDADGKFKAFGVWE